MKSRRVANIWFVVMWILIWGFATKGFTQPPLSSGFCAIDTVIYGGRFSICKDTGNNIGLVQYKQIADTILWPESCIPAMERNGILYLGDTSLNAQSAFFFDSVYFFCLSDTDINQGILYCIKLSSSDAPELFRNVEKGYCYLLAKYGQFIIDTNGRRILIANSPVSYGDDDSEEVFTFSIFDFSGNSFKFDNAMMGETHYLYMKEQMINVRMRYKSMLKQ
jgi:hypothetical protein